MSERHDFKIVVSFGGQGTKTINLDYQHGCHYEPLVEVEPTLTTSVKTSNLNFDHNQCKATYSSHKEPVDEKAQQEDIQLFLEL